MRTSKGSSSRFPWARARAPSTRTSTVEPGKTVAVVFEISCGLVGTLFGRLRAQ